MNLSVVLPAKNEEKRLSMTISDVHRFLEHRQIEHEIIVAISPSEDDSLEIAQRLEHAMPELQVLDLKEDNGKGYALKQGIKNAKGDWVLLMDSDGCVGIEEVEKMLPHTREFKLINGIRVGKPSEDNQSLTFKEKCGKVCKSIVNSMKVNDSQCSFKLIESKLANRILKKSKVQSYSFETEILTIARDQHSPIKEIPVSWQNTHNNKQDSEKYGKGLTDFIKIKENLKNSSYKGR